MPQIKVYETESFPDALRWQVIAFLRVEWPFIFEGEGRYGTHPYPLSLPQIHIAAVEGDVLLSYATLVQFDILNEGEQYRTFGLGNMFTFPPYRGEGWARRVIDRATQTLASTDSDVGALLCDPQLVPMYAASGWVAAKAPTYEGTPEAAKPVDATLMLSFVSPRAHKARHVLMQQSVYVAEKW